MSHPEIQNNLTKQSLATLGNSFQCDFCMYFCKSRYKILDHMKMSHPEIQNFSTKEDSNPDNLTPTSSK